MSVEFPYAAREYPIVFGGDEKTVLPLAVLGVRDKQNLYLDHDGSWNAKYIPAFVRRYPFVFSADEGGANFTLCIDESFAGFNQEDRGERLFTGEGERTEYLEKVLNFLSDYQAQYQRTKAYCSRLKELELLEPMQAQFTLPSGQQHALTGFMAINRERVKSLAQKKLSELAKNDELELTYAHLLSMNNFKNMLALT